MFNAILHIVKPCTQSTVKNPKAISNSWNCTECQSHIKVIKEAANCAVAVGTETTYGSLYLQDRRMILFFFFFPMGEKLTSWHDFTGYWQHKSRRRKIQRGCDTPSQNLFTVILSIDALSEVKIVMNVSVEGPDTIFSVDDSQSPQFV